MPLKKGSSKKTVQANFHEFRHGAQYKKDVKKFGKKKANKMMVAAVLSTSDKSKKRRTTRK